LHIYIVVVEKLTKVIVYSQYLSIFRLSPTLSGAGGTNKPDNKKQNAWCRRMHACVIIAELLLSLSLSAFLAIAYKQEYISFISYLCFII
jgi:hypothetical protein